MSFQPALPIGGYAGWQFLKRTMEAQQAQLARSPALQRDTEYFRETIGKISSAEELVGDRRLLRVALGAFGLDDDLANRFFIRKVLEEGTVERGALATRLADTRYREMSAAFGFGPGEVPGVRTPGFSDRIVAAFESRQFERAVGVQNEDMRLALNLTRDLADVARRDSSERAKWFTVMGTPPLRQVFETAFGLPRGFGLLDVDRQQEILQDKAQRLFGDTSVAQFADPAKMDDLVRRFLLQAELENGALGPTTRGLAAVQLLQPLTQPSGLAFRSLLQAPF
jgi:hypothetical protein